MVPHSRVRSRRKMLCRRKFSQLPSRNLSLHLRPPRSRFAHKGRRRCNLLVRNNSGPRPSNRIRNSSLPKTCL
jgi:hypothetical protein